MYLILENCSLVKTQILHYLMFLIQTVERIACLVFTLCVCMHVCPNPRMGGHLCVAAFLFLSGVVHLCVNMCVCWWVGICVCMCVAAFEFLSECCLISIKIEYPK